MSGLPSYSIGILVVSDTVSSGAKADASGAAVARFLRGAAHMRPAELREACVPDERGVIAETLRGWCDGDAAIDLALTVGGTGFSPRDVTPEATREVLEREAPQLALRMALACCEHVPTAALSRGVCGTRNRTLIVNLPGSARGAVESLEVAIPILPHALDQLKGATKKVAALHKKIQTPD